MFVQLDHLKTKELQSDLDGIQTVFEVFLFDVADKKEYLNTLAIHQQVLLNCQSLSIEKTLDLNTLTIEKLDSTLVNLDNLLLEEPDLFSERNWFLSLLIGV